METTYVTQWFPPEPAQISDGLARSLQSRGHTVNVLTGIPNYPTGVVPEGYKAWKPVTERSDGITVRRAPLFPSHDSSAVKRMLNYVSWAVSATFFGFRTLKRSDVAIVYSGPATGALPVMVWRRLARTPYVLMIQDLWPDSVLATGFLTRGIVRRIADTTLSWFCSWSYKSAAHIVVISPGAIALLESRGVPREKISLVYNWAEESIAYASVDPADARAEFGLPKDAFVISYAGNYGLAQGLDVVLKAARLVKDLTDVHFLFVGDGLEAESLKELADSLGCQRVTFAGPVPHKRMTSVQSASDVQLISLTDDPLFRITMPSKVQSILASGTAAVAIAAGDAANVVDQSGAGWSVAPGDYEQLATVIRTAHAEGHNRLTDRGRTARDYYRRHMSEAVGSARLDEILKTVAEDSVTQRTKKGPKK